MIAIELSGLACFPPNAHRIQCVQLFASPTAWPSAKPTGWLFFFSARASFSIPSRSLAIIWSRYDGGSPFIGNT